MQFTYTAKSQTGVATSGIFDAGSEGEARRRLREQGLFVLSLAREQPLRTGAVARSLRAARPRISRKEVLMVFSQLSIMCQSGVDLADALASLAEQCPRPGSKAVLEAVCHDVQAGISLSEALRRQKAFEETLIAAIAAGEQSGSLVLVLERVTQLVRNDLRLRGTIWSMLMYPLVLCGVTFLVLCAMVFFVLPQFAQVFRDLDRPAPPLTQALLGAGDWIANHLTLVALAGLGAVGAVLAVIYSPLARRWWDHAVLHLAMVRRASRPLMAGRTFRLLGTMLQTGIPLLDGIRLCRSAAGNLVFREALENVERDVLQGKGLGPVLRTMAFLPEGAAQMIATAERTGKLGQVLQSVGEHFEDEGERGLRDLIKILEPAIIIGLGGIVAMVVLAVILPLLDVSTMSGG